jgi:hypothetical protein
MERMFRRGTGSSSAPACGRLVTCIARGTACGALAQLLTVSRKTTIKSSMKPSTRAVDESGS